ncbi:hypothetical protein HY604_04275 [Candidatus Peregrinibacteria bacterium]|nr:hypothetical protein [Candidatus Peregrinibacteria bacterium]
MYKLKLHKNLTLEKWSKFKKHQQILMIANEINRLLNGLDKQTLAELTECMERAIELIDLTINSHEKNLRKELLRFRDLFAINYLHDRESLKKARPQIAILLHTLLFLDSKSAKTV